MFVCAQCKAENKVEDGIFCGECGFKNEPTPTPTPAPAPALTLTLTSSSLTPDPTPSLLISSAPASVVTADPSVYLCGKCKAENKWEDGVFCGECGFKNEERKVEGEKEEEKEKEGDVSGGLLTVSSELDTM